MPDAYILAIAEVGHRLFYDLSYLGSTDFHVFDVSHPNVATVAIDLRQTTVSPSIYDIVSAVGTLLSLAGVLIALRQLSKTRLAAEAAQRAAVWTRAAISRNVLLSDLTACTTGLEEIKVLVRGKRHEAALLRVSDVSRQLIQLQHVRKGAPDSKGEGFKETLSQLSVLRDLLERVLAKEEGLNPVQVNRVLAEAADAINAVIGEMKFEVRESQP